MDLSNIRCCRVRSGIETFTRDLEKPICKAEQMQDNETKRDEYTQHRRWYIEDNNIKVGRMRGKND